VFDRLKRVLKEAQDNQDLPNYLAEEIERIISEPERFAGREDEISELADKIELYDTYGQTGYLGMGVNNAILERTLKRFLK